MKIVKNIILLALLCFLLSSCSTTITPLQLNEVALSRTEVSKVLDIPIQSIEVNMDVILDKRSSGVIATLDELEIRSNEKLSQKITNSISKTLKNSGFSIGSNSEVKLSGFLKEYNANIKGRFPSVGSAKVQFVLSANNLASRKSYKAQYLGTTNLQNFSAKQSDLSEMLDKALESALKQMVKDENLIHFLKGN